MLTRRCSVAGLCCWVVCGAVCGWESHAADQAEIDAAIREASKASKSAVVYADARSLVEQLLTTTADALASDLYSDALRAVKLAGDIARSSGNNQLAYRVSLKAEEVRVQTREFRQFSSAVKRLAEKADDPDANLSVGLYRSLGQGQWELGGRLLQRSRQAPFPQIGSGEIAQPTDIAEQIALALSWQSASIENNWLKQAALNRAYYWYSLAYRQATGTQLEALYAKLGTLPIRSLSDLREEVVENGPWGFGKYGDNGRRRPILVDGFPYELGLGVHPPFAGNFRVRYKLDGQYRTLTTGCGLCDNRVAFAGTITFSVVGDGRVLWTSKPVKKGSDAEFATINVKGVQVLDLVCNSARRHVDGHGVWLDPWLSK